MKALFSALALLSFVAATTVPFVSAQAQTHSTMAVKKAAAKKKVASKKKAVAKKKTAAKKKKPAKSM